MKLQIIGHDDRYAVEQLQMQLFGDELQEGGRAVSVLSRGKTWLTATAKVTYRDKTARAAKRLRVCEETVPLRRRILQQAYYLAATQVLGRTMPWGALAGVRPTKLSTKAMLSGASAREAEKMLRDTYFVSPERSRLCAACSAHTVEALGDLRKNDLSLYIGIPFCPTRCAYCSFVSQSVESFGNLVQPYLDALLLEVKRTGELLRESGFRVRTLYIGGGTPTTLSTLQMQTLLGAIAQAFDLSDCLEYTVEGGRPDTLDAEKLRAIAENGVDRMSINPQTMNDEILRVIGRRHTAEEIVQAYRDAKAAGFRTVNMDLIAGLPDDTPKSFRASLAAVLALAPENITVHTLARKKGADLFFQGEKLPSAQDVAAMLDDTMRLLPEHGYEPYYLYRQKYMAGSFENVGWCKKGHSGRYNIYMMEEAHSILALGCGGMNKVNLAENDLERFHNPKYPQEYIRRIDDVLEKKREVFALLKSK